MESIQTGMAAVAKLANLPAPSPDNEGVFHLSFEDGLDLRAFSVPGRELVFEGEVAGSGAAGDNPLSLCRTMLQVQLARYRQKSGQLYRTAQGALVYARQYLPGSTERLDFVMEAEAFLNELSLMRGRATGQGTSSPGMGGLFSFRRP